MPRILFFLLVVSCFSPILVSQQRIPAPDLLTLDEAVSLALENNREIRISALEAEKANEDVSAFRTHRLPIFMVSGIGSSLLTSASFEFKQGVFGNYPGIGPIPTQNTDITTPRRLTGFMSNSIMQPVSQLYKISLGVRSRELLRDIAREQLRVRRHQVRNQVTRLYYNLVQTQSEIEASTQSVAFYAELDRVTDQFLLQKVVLKSDSMDVKVRLARQQVETLKLRNDLESHQEQLNRLLGRDIRQRFRVSSTTLPTLAELDLSVAQSQALAQRPELRQAQLKIKQAADDRKLKKAEYIPDVSLAVQQVSFLNFEMLPTNVLSAGLALSWEPFDWGRKRHELAAKSRTIEQAETEARETEAQVLEDVNTQFRKVQANAAMLRVAELAMDAAAEKLRVAKDQYQVKTVRLDRVLEIEAELATASSQYQKALSDYWTAKADLAKAVGDE